MIQYILEIILWTILLYAFYIILENFIYKTVISKEKIKEFKESENIKYKTISENNKTK